MDYIKRAISPILKKRVETAKCVLVTGARQVGKSTVINAVLGEEKAKTGFGISGTTSELEIYESDAVPFSIIDTIGFEPTFFKEKNAINAVKKWSKNSAKNGQEDKQINRPALS